MAIEDCHKNNISRLSLHPENILIDRFNRIRLHCFQTAVKFNENKPSEIVNEGNLFAYEEYAKKSHLNVRSIEEAKETDLREFSSIF